MLNNGLDDRLNSNRSRNLFFHYGNERIDFYCVPQTAKKETVSIKVNPDCQVVVASPVHKSDVEVIQVVKQRSRWIYKQLESFRKHTEHQHIKQYISGETQYYLGKRYVLKVIVVDDEDKSQPQSVKLKGGQLQVYIHRKNSETHKAEIVKKLLNDWYRKRADEVLKKRLLFLMDGIDWIDTPPPIKLITMKKQWGSCSPLGNIVLNPHLVKASRECIDYVIIHELCHLIEHNHSDEFYSLLAQIMPHWKEVKTRLDGNVELYL